MIELKDVQHKDMHNDTNTCTSVQCTVQSNGIDSNLFHSKLNNTSKLKINK